MVAGVSLTRAVEAVGHNHATRTRDLIRGLNALAVLTAVRLRRVSHNKPILPVHCIVAISRDAPAGEQRKPRAHWMVSW